MSDKIDPEESAIILLSEGEGANWRLRMNGKFGCEFKPEPSIDDEAAVESLEKAIRILVLPSLIRHDDITSEGRCVDIKSIQIIQALQRAEVIIPEHMLEQHKWRETSLSPRH